MIRRHQSLLDAYAGDGWRGAASQKPKPLGELALAREKIFKGKVKIRELFKGLEFDPNERAITPVEDELGETDAADIFCSKCAMADDREEDDILLCDGFCDRAYHQSCVVPVVKTEDIPPDDEGWLCPLCDARVDVIYVLNDEYEQDLGQKCVAEDVFKAEAEMQEKGIVPGTAQFAHAHEEAWPSDESEDEDFDHGRASDDGRDDENEALSGSARSSSEESSSESESDLIIEGPRRRTKVEYGKVNSDMCGDDEAYEGEAEELGWKRSNKTKAEMLAALQNKNVGSNAATSSPKTGDKKRRKDNCNDNGTAEKRHRARARFSSEQKATLERLFQTGTRVPKSSALAEIAADVGASSPSSIRIWFMNRRRKDRT